MAETGSVKVRIDDAMLRRRIRNELADAWDEGHDEACYCGDFPDVREHNNPYR